MNKVIKPIAAAAAVVALTACQQGGESAAEAELQLEIRGTHGIGWAGDPFSAEELGGVREWLFGKAMSIYGGSYEIQNNIISKNILGLPETTQKG